MVFFVVVALIVNVNVRWTNWTGWIWFRGKSQRLNNTNNNNNNTTEIRFKFENNVTIKMNDKNGICTVMVLSTWNKAKLERHLLFIWIICVNLSLSMFLCLGHLFRLLYDNHAKSKISFRALMTTYHRNSKVNLFLISVLYFINSKLKYKLQFASWCLMFTQLLMTL